jgi:hypothetical protein
MPKRILEIVRVVAAVARFVGDRLLVGPIRHPGHWV